MPLNVSFFLVSAGFLDLRPRGGYHDLNFLPRPLSLVLPVSLIIVSFTLSFPPGSNIFRSLNPSLTPAFLQLSNLKLIQPAEYL